MSSISIKRLCDLSFPLGPDRPFAYLPEPGSHWAVSVSSAEATVGLSCLVQGLARRTLTERAPPRAERVRSLKSM